MWSDAPGQARTISFTVTGFTLPIAMVYTEAPAVSAQIPGIATSEAAAKAFVERLVMHTVFDVLQGQGQSALLPDVVISSILSQLSVQVNYDPMKCQMAVKPEEKPGQDKVSCIIVGSTVTGICTTTDRGQDSECLTTVPQMVTVTPVPDTHLKISGTISTTNIIMASWSKAMWQNVVNRAIRMLAWGPFGSHFISATATVN
ncbi:hypothetical protein KIN20_011519 [Parelaphostrongylus tenuis]|uniref:Uncharacterized protein n=1 Tax=Parelaphostrongylus tenuis TaxID=148309 RepID=A0AAD5MV52_PARTN|nr:hypothetical protein KIN20_011519 [Parelaphostrongylus tenuis]